MPATNYTPIQLYRSTTSGNVPSAANLSAGEIALNIADNDMTMYFENASGTVKSFFNNPAALKYPTADGTSGQIIQTNGAGVLSFGSAPSSALTNNTRQAVTSSATTTINLNSGNVIDLTMAANITTLSFTNVPASGTPILIQIVVRNASNGTAYTIVWPNSVYWSGQYALSTFPQVLTAPTLATGANGVTVLALLTTDGGTKWRGWVEAAIPGGTENAVYSWGVNYEGQGAIGFASGSSKFSSPNAIGGATNWIKITSGGKHALALTASGTIFSWGYGGQGRLGQNSTANISSPTQIGTGTNWTDIGVGDTFSGGIRAGQLWTWGNNSGGRLGINASGSGVYRSSPVQVGSLSTWAKFRPCLDGGAAITTSGTLFTWGLNGFGQLGNNGDIYAEVSSPVQVGALTTWADVRGSYRTRLGLTTSGTLFAWGSGGLGTLGLGSSPTYLASPNQVGSLSTWAQVACNQASFGITTGGALFAWGQGTYGANGLNSTSNVNSPTQLGLSTSWSAVEAGNRFAIASENGKLFSWGSNSVGALGLNDTIFRSSPTQVGALTTWTTNRDMLAPSSRATNGLFCFSAIATVISPA